MKSYGQYCALARGLDVIGDRWTLLVVRELLTGPRRYSQLLEGLPGIATNLLADRLRSLEADGVVTRDADGRYQLTDWGQGLSQTLHAIARWAAPLMARPVRDDAFQSAWLALPVAVIFEGVDHRRPRLTIEIRSDDAPVTIESRDGMVQLELRPAESPDLIITGPPEGIIAVLMDTPAGAAVQRQDVSIQGDARQLAKLRSPQPAP